MDEIIKNQLLNSGIELVDDLNTQFYGRILYPWPTAIFEKIDQTDFWNKFIAQDIGYWGEDIIPENANIWVAGCGTNQALLTALKFPTANVLGSDLSVESLELCEANVAKLGIHNLRLKHESINSASYDNEFDYVICTGVIHHNADPAYAINKLSQSLQSSGILELMVYNQYHRIRLCAFQKAVRILADKNTNDFDAELALAKTIVDAYPYDNDMKNFLSRYQNSTDSEFSDALLQPIEKSYTIESLAALVESADLNLLNFCIDQFSKVDNRLTWEFDFKSEMLNKIYLEHDDYTRWQISNLLFSEESPMLWFYFNKKNSNFKRKPTKTIQSEFLKKKFKKISAKKQVYFINDKGEIENGKQFDFPGNLGDQPKLIKDVFDLCDGFRTIEDIFKKLCIDTSDFFTIELCRAKLTTSAFPYLCVV